MSSGDSALRAWRIHLRSLSVSVVAGFAGDGFGSFVAAVATDMELSDVWDAPSSLSSSRRRMTVFRNRFAARESWTWEKSVLKRARWAAALAWPGAATRGFS